MDANETTTAADLAAYERAAERFNRAAEHAPRIRELCRQLADAADAEYDAAAADLARYETKPGVPKPEYRVKIAQDESEELYEAEQRRQQRVSEAYREFRHEADRPAVAREQDSRMGRSKRPVRGFGVLDAEAGEPGPRLGSDQNDMDSEVTS
jgi:hypothetical protein